MTGIPLPAPRSLSSVFPPRLINFIPECQIVIARENTTSFSNATIRSLSSAASSVSCPIFCVSLRLCFIRNEISFSRRQNYCFLIRVSLWISFAYSSFSCALTPCRTCALKSLRSFVISCSRRVNALSKFWKVQETIYKH